MEDRDRREIKKAFLQVKKDIHELRSKLNRNYFESKSISEKVGTATSKEEFYSFVKTIGAKLEELEEHLASKRELTKIEKASAGQIDVLKRKIDRQDDISAQIKEVKQLRTFYNELKGKKVDKKDVDKEFQAIRTQLGKQGTIKKYLDELSEIKGELVALDKRSVDWKTYRKAENASQTLNTALDSDIKKIKTDIANLQSENNKFDDLNKDILTISDSIDKLKSDITENETKLANKKEIFKEIDDLKETVSEIKSTIDRSVEEKDLSDFVVRKEFDTEITKILKDLDKKKPAEGISKKEFDAELAKISKELEKKQSGSGITKKDFDAEISKIQNEISQVSETNSAYATKDEISDEIEKVRDAIESSKTLYDEYITRDELEDELLNFQKLMKKSTDDTESSKDLDKTAKKIEKIEEQLLVLTELKKTISAQSGDIESLNKETATISELQTEFKNLAKSIATEGKKGEITVKEVAKDYDKEIKKINQDVRYISDNLISTSDFNSQLNSIKDILDELANDNKKLNKQLESKTKQLEDTTSRVKELEKGLKQTTKTINKVSDKKVATVKTSKEKGVVSSMRDWLSDFFVEEETLPKPEKKKEKKDDGDGMFFFIVLFAALVVIGGGAFLALNILGNSDQDQPVIPDDQNQSMSDENDSVLIPIEDLENPDEEPLNVSEDTNDTESNESVSEPIINETVNESSLDENISDEEFDNEIINGVDANDGQISEIPNEITEEEREILLEECISKYECTEINGVFNYDCYLDAENTCRCTRGETNKCNPVTIEEATDQKGFIEENILVISAIAILIALGGYIFARKGEDEPKKPKNKNGGKKKDEEFDLSEYFVKK